MERFTRHLGKRLSDCRSGYLNASRIFAIGWRDSLGDENAARLFLRSHRWRGRARRDRRAVGGAD